MPNEKTVYECSHDEFRSCSKTSTNKAVIQYHERRHEIDHLIDRISDVHDHKHFVQEEVVEWLEDWLEYGKMAGLVDCQSCGAEVHGILEQCPECHKPIHELQTTAKLCCSDCGSDNIIVYQKGGNRMKQGLRCADCHAFVAHGDGFISMAHDPTGDLQGFWEEQE